MRSGDFGSGLEANTTNNTVKAVKNTANVFMIRQIAPIFAVNVTAFIQECISINIKTGPILLGIIRFFCLVSVPCVISRDGSSEEWKAWDLNYGMKLRS